jgi:hypothetical protein
MCRFKVSSIYVPALLKKVKILITRLTSADLSQQQRSSSSSDTVKLSSSSSIMCIPVCKRFLKLFLNILIKKKGGLFKIYLVILSPKS